MATISSGRFTVASKARMRSVSSSVLPDPAGACTINERDGSIAATRTAASLGWRIDTEILLIQTQKRQYLAVPQIINIKHHIGRHPLGEFGHQGFDGRSPALQHLVPTQAIKGGPRGEMRHIGKTAIAIQIGRASCREREQH